jgi:hypothetical protein
MTRVSAFHRGLGSIGETWLRDTAGKTGGGSGAIWVRLGFAQNTGEKRRYAGGRGPEHPRRSQAAVRCEIGFVWGLLKTQGRTQTRPKITRVPASHRGLGSIGETWLRRHRREDRRRFGGDLGSFGVYSKHRGKAQTRRSAPLRIGCLREYDAAQPFSFAWVTGRRSANVEHFGCSHAPRFQDSTGWREV